MTISTRRFALAVIAIFALLIATLPAADAAQKKNPPKGGVVELQVIQYSDWHGQVEPLDVFGQGVFGGAAELATYFKQERANNPNTIIITGGDDFGATPPLVNFFDEVPAVLAQNLMGTDVSALGNHNFDKGVDHLQKMVDLAEYQYLGANLENLDANLNGVEPYKLFHFPGIKVAVIGVTNEEAPTLVFPGSFGTIEISDAAQAAQRIRDRLARQGVDVFILVGHDGVRTVDPPSGELIDLASQVNGFDLVLGDHTDVEFSGEINGALVTENRSRGRTYARFNLTVKTGKGGVIDKSITFVDPVSSAVEKDPEVEAMLDEFRAQLGPIFDNVIATTTGFWPRGGNYERLGESEVGNLMADSLLSTYGTDFALTNAGGIRSPLPSGYVPQDTSVDRNGVFPEDLVVGDIFAFHTFGNEAVTRNITGSVLWQAVEHGLSVLPGASGRFPAIAGFRVIYDSAAPAGSKVLSIEMLDGTSIAADGTVYTIAVNNFINSGGDGYGMLNDGQGTSRDFLTGAVQSHIETLGTITPYFDCRLVDVNPAGPAVTRQDCSAFLP